MLRIFHFWPDWFCHVVLGVFQHKEVTFYLLFPKSQSQAINYQIRHICRALQTEIVEALDV